MTRTKHPMKRTKSPEKKKGAKTGPKPPYLNYPLDMVTSLAKLGATNKQMAEAYGVTEGSIEYWKKNYPEFKAAFDAGGVVADSKVAKALFQRALGYEYEEFSIETNSKGDVTRRTTTKHVVADVKAAIHWLRNRQREQWTISGDLMINHNHKGSIEHYYKEMKDIPVHELPPEEQKYLFNITKKQIEAGERDN